MLSRPTAPAHDRPARDPSASSTPPAPRRPRYKVLTALVGGALVAVAVALAAAGGSVGPRPGSGPPAVTLWRPAAFVLRMGDRAPVARPRAAPPARVARAVRREPGMRMRGAAIPMTARSVAAFLPLYRRAAATFGVSWRLIASVHQQETAFSSAPGTYRGLNFARCCAGPMQFNVTNGPVTTWDRFSGAFHRASRPSRYPHRTWRHPSVYDDFDAIMASASLLAASGAGSDLDGAAWMASYGYYGHDATGLDYADAVLARATGWARTGFCVRCGLDAGLIARFDTAFAAPLRAQMIAAARAAARRRRHHHKHPRHHGAHRRRAGGRKPHSAPRGGDRPAASKPTPAPATAAPHAAPAAPPAAPPAAAPAPAAPAPVAPAPPPAAAPAATTAAPAAAPPPPAP
jgi:hypothetical protein